jgi:hypothetical protein
VKLKDGTVPVGTVRLVWGAKKSDSMRVRLRASHRGAVTVRIPGLKRGTHKLTATFIDATGAVAKGKGRAKVEVVKRPGASTSAPPSSRPTGAR